MLKNIGKLSQGLGGMVSSASRTRKYVTGAGLDAAAQASRRAKYGIAGKGASPVKATRAYEQAVAKRQTQVGNRVIAGTAIMGGASVLGSDKKSYYNPMPAPRGTGRYA